MEAEQKRSFLVKRDAGWIFLKALLIPILLAIIVSGAIGIVNSFLVLLGIKWQIAGLLYSVILLFLTQAGMFFAFVHHLKSHKINAKIALKLEKKLNPSDVVIAIFISLFSIFLFLPIINLAEQLFISWGYNPSASFNEFTGLPGFVLGLIFVAVIPSIVEELIFRGVMVGGYNKEAKYIPVIISTAAFVLMHGNLSQTLYPLIMGVVFAGMFIRTGNIKLNIITHFVNNAIAVGIGAFVTVSESASVKITLSVVIESIAYALVGVAVIYGLIKALKQEKDIEKPKQDAQQNSQEELTATPESFGQKNQLNMPLIAGYAVASVLWLFSTIISFV